MSNTKIVTLADLRKEQARERKAAGITTPWAPALPIVRDTPVTPPANAPNGGFTHVSTMEGASNVTISGGAQIISAAGPLRRTAKKKIVTGTWPKGEEAPDEIKVETFKNATGVKIIDSTVENFVVSGLKAKPGQKLLVRLGEGAATDLTYHGEACYVVNSHDYTIDIEDGDSEQGT